MERKTESRQKERYTPLLTNIYLVRHGDPQMNTGLEYNVMPGPPLSEQGKVESRQAAVFLADKGVQSLFASPFARTSQTVKELAGYLELPVTLTELLAEHAPQESEPQVRERVLAFVQGVEDTPFTSIAAVTHGSPIRQLLVALTEGKVDLRGHFYGRGNPAPTAGIWHVHREEELWQARLVFRPAPSHTVL